MNSLLRAKVQEYRSYIHEIGSPLTSCVEFWTDILGALLVDTGV
jgi:hypothetical protein